MDGREAMASYYMQRGLAGSGSGTPTGLHGPSGIRPFSGPSLTVPSNIASPVSSGYGVDSPAVISPHAVSMGQGPAGMAPVEPVKRKRGRPRKYGPDGAVALALSPLSSSGPAGSSSASPSVAPQQKRGRGRPPGSGKKQQLASLGEWLSGSAGTGFTPHIITISIGEDIATKIMSFSQQGPRAVCILSANGAVSTVTLRQPAVSGGTVTYEGRFEILSLSGSYLVTESGTSRSRTGGLSVTLASPDGRVIGGGVAGLLLAASPVQVIVGSFTYGGSKTQNKEGTKPEPSGDSEIQAGERAGSPTRAPPTQNPAASMMMASGWPGSRPMDLRNAHLDIDLTRG